jgi:hypothetical protein
VFCQFELAFRGDAAMRRNFLDDGVFEPEATALMGEAFDAACKELPFPKHKWARELVAQRIIAAARRGVLDLGRLRSFALAGMSHIMARSGS